MRKYINIRRIKGDRFPCGHLNIPYGNEFYVEGQFICIDMDGAKKPVCWETSERAYTDFAYDDDGRGIERKQLINECHDMMARIPNKDEEFVKFFDDAVAMRYKKHPKDTNEWSWDRYKVHTAPVEDLRHIKDVILTMNIVK